jgi:hypothetical protein
MDLIGMNSLGVQTFVALFVSTFALKYLFEGFGISGMTEHKGRKLTSKPTFLAYLTVAFFVTTYCTYLGFVGYFLDCSEACLDHIYGVSATATKLAAVMFGYQSWNFVMCIYVKEYRNATTLGHHGATALLSYHVAAPFVHYYAFFYIGVAEISTIPLSFVDLNKYFPELVHGYLWVVEGCKKLFALLFFACRVILWPIVSVSFWRDNWPSVTGESPVHDKSVLYFFLFCNTGLTFLQFYWGWLIIKSLLGGVKIQDRSKQSRN